MKIGAFVDEVTCDHCVYNGINEFHWLIWTTIVVSGIGTVGMKKGV